MHRASGPLRNQRGSALVVALLVLMTLAVLVVVLTTTVTSERRSASYNVRAQKALNIAEAGISEAIERISKGDIPDNGDPKMVAQIFLTNPGDVPPVGTDTTAMGTVQPAGKWMAYTSVTKGPKVLTIEYKTDQARTKIYRYSAKATPPIQTAVGSPIFVIKATGTVGDVERTVVVEATDGFLAPKLLGAITGRKKVELAGNNSYANGYDHQAETPTGTCNDRIRHGAWETSFPSIAGLWSSKDAKLGGGALADGTPAIAKDQAGFYAGPWEALGMSQTAFYQWLGPPSDEKKQGNPRGITYIDKEPEKPQDAKGDHELKGYFNGDGFLYCDGNLKINGDFTFRGLIYVEGKLELKGGAWVLGGIVAGNSLKLKNSYKAGKMPTVVISSIQAIRKNLAKYGSSYMILAWREV